MKKTILSLVAVLFSLAIMAQTENGGVGQTGDIYEQHGRIVERINGPVPIDINGGVDVQKELNGSIGIHPCGDYNGRTTRYLVTDNNTKETFTAIILGLEVEVGSIIAYQVIDGINDPFDGFTKVITGSLTHIGNWEEATRK